jgi:hypothetical protein
MKLQAICNICSEKEFLLKNVFDETKKIKTKCEYCGRKIDCVKISFFENTKIKDMNKNFVYENDVLLNPFFGDLWTVNKVKNKWKLILNEEGSVNHIDSAKNFIIVAHNSNIKDRFIPGLKKRKTTFKDKEGRTIHFDQPINLKECVNKFLKKVGYKIEG